MQTAKLFGTQEKPFHLALKGVHYESGTQKCRCLDAAHDKEEESPSSETEDDDDEDEGAVAKIKPLKSTRSKVDHWMKVKHVTLKSPSNFPLGQFFVIFQILSKFPFPCFHLHSGSPYQNLKSHMKFEI